MASHATPRSDGGDRGDTRHVYDDHFYDYISRELGASAQQVSALLHGVFEIDSVVDFGCGRGTWLAAWKASGVAEVAGVDGDYVRRDALLIDSAEFHAHDLGKPLSLGRRFDLVESLEVAEHLPESAAGAFIDMLCDHGSVVLFAAAVPGQGGEHHINEQPYDYWRGHFARRGYVAIDLIRPALRGRKEIAFWYRYNLLVYVDHRVYESMRPVFEPHRVPTGTPIPDVSPWVYRLRKALLRQLSPTLMTRVAEIKKRIAPGRSA